jgi:hypothetical protein
MRLLQVLLLPMATHNCHPPLKFDGVNAASCQNHRDRITALMVAIDASCGWITIVHGLPIALVTATMGTFYAS